MHHIRGGRLEMRSSLHSIFLGVSSSATHFTEFKPQNAVFTRSKSLERHQWIFKRHTLFWRQTLVWLMPQFAIPSYSSVHCSPTHRGPCSFWVPLRMQWPSPCSPLSTLEYFGFFDRVPPSRHYSSCFSLIHVDIRLSSLQGKDLSCTQKANSWYSTFHFWRGLTSMCASSELYSWLSVWSYLWTTTYSSGMYILGKLGGKMLWIECRENMVRDWLIHKAKLVCENFKLQLQYRDVES